MTHVEAGILFREFPDIKTAFSLTHSLRMIFSQRCTKEKGAESLRSCCTKVGEFGNKEIDFGAKLALPALLAEFRINAMMERTKETSEAAGISLETGGFAFMVSDMDGYLLLLSADYRLLARRISFRGAKDIKTRLVDGIQLMTLQIVDGLAI